jgi:hypothetical protein
VKIRLMGTGGECWQTVEALRQAIGILSVSDPYPCRGASREVRVYVEARLAPLTEPEGKDQ